jgi:hypothetical protein
MRAERISMVVPHDGFLHLNLKLQDLQSDQGANKFGGKEQTYRSS